MRRLTCSALVLAATLGAAGEARASYLLWTQDNSADVQPNLGDIRQANIDGSGQKVLLRGLTYPTGLAVDAAANRMYWSEQNVSGPGEIRYANLNGSNPKALLSSLNSPFGLALNHEGQLYWIDNGVGTINKVNTDASHGQIVLSAGNAALLALDPAGGKMYWTAPTGNNVGQGVIRRAGIDGSGPTTIATATDSFGIALDLVDGKVYWTEFNGNVTNGGDIRRSNMDGTGAQILVRNLSGPVGIALDIPDGEMYWTDFTGGDIREANLDGSQAKTVISGLSFPAQIAVVPEPASILAISVMACGMLGRRKRK